MAKPHRKYRPPEAGPLHLRESVRRPLLALAGSTPPEAHLNVSQVEDVERALRCELPEEILACFANADATRPAWGFTHEELSELMAQAREMGYNAELVAVGHNPSGSVLYCIERRGELAASGRTCGVRL